MRKSTKGLILQMFLSTAVMVGSVGVAYLTITLTSATGQRNPMLDEELELALRVLALVVAIAVGGIASAKAYRLYNLEQAIQQVLLHEVVFVDELMPDIGWRSAPIAAAASGVACLMSLTFGETVVFWIVGWLCVIMLIAGVAAMVVLAVIALRWRTKRKAVAKRPIIVECYPYTIAGVCIQRSRVLPVEQAPEYYDCFVF